MRDPMSRQQEQGCRAGRKPIDERLAEKDQRRHELRAEGMKGVGNWPTGRKGRR